VQTDVALQGDGFFILDDGGLRLYTRAGTFELDANGFMVSSTGANVLGFPAVNGVVSSNTTLVPLQINTGQISAPNPTTNIEITMNLNADDPVGTTFSTAIGVVDSLGSTHIVTANFTKTGTNTWDYDLTVPAVDVGGLITDPPVVLNFGTLTFDGTGQLILPAADVTGITITGFVNGANDLTFDWQLYDPNGGSIVTQVSSPSATFTTRQDGFPAGTLLDFSIQGDGTIQGVFSNGQTLALGQIALATFPNVQGMLRDGNNNFLASLSSGQPNTGVPGTGGRGSVSGGALELSNVDIAREFSRLILAQRAFQANARTFTTFDEVTQETINLKR
jgi:flagellar hook protein FlgE